MFLVSNPLGNLGDEIFKGNLGPKESIKGLLILRCSYHPAIYLCGIDTLTVNHQILMSKHISKIHISKSNYIGK